MVKRVLRQSNVDVKTYPFFTGRADNIFFNLKKQQNVILIDKLYIHLI